MKSIKLKDTFRKRFIAAEFDTLVIETIQTIEENKESPGAKLCILKLKGIWYANDYNELCFEVSARKGPPETYIFKGSWKLNKNQQVEYTSEDGHDTLTFKGYWNISSANRLVYLFEGSSTSRFEFKVQLESSMFYPKKGEIRYRIGVGLRQSRLTAPGKILILYGEWRFGRDLGLTFQMDYGQGNIRAIEFGATVTFGRNKFIFALKDEFGKPLGITLAITHKFLEHLDAEVFLRLKSRQKEQVIETGISIPF